MTDYTEFLKKLKKTYKDDGSQSAMLRDLVTEPIVIDAISTGSLQVDMLTGIGGFPRGRISELFGQFASGKTSLAYSAIREAQRLGLRAAYIDSEFAFNPRWAVNQGVDISEDKLIFAQPEIGEVALDLVEDLVRNAVDHDIALIILDSVPSLVPLKELAADSVGAEFMGTRAKMLSKACQRLKGIVSKTNTALVFINQVRDKVGNPYGGRYRPGGVTLDYASSLILEVKKGDQIMEGITPIGTTINVSGFKSKFGAFHKDMVPEVRIYLKGGVSRSYDILKAGCITEIITQKGAWYYLNDIKLGQGENNVERYLNDNPELLEDIERQVRETLSN